MLLCLQCLMDHPLREWYFYPLLVKSNLYTFSKLAAYFPLLKRLSITKYLNDYCRISKLINSQELRGTDNHLFEKRILCQLPAGPVNYFNNLLKIRIICN